ncbi:MAG TPA: transmembrane domain-containing protein [Ktedonobacteraceae bacterium]|nr:transmembrane domain-containing protein [Ktedonobacteraceae bacterium]
MQNQAHRMRAALVRVALRVVGVASLCFVALSLLALHSAASTYATSGLLSADGTVMNSPYSGPVGATIAVSGSGWTDEANGTMVSFGYMVGSDCFIVTDAQNGTFQNSAFSGWFRWPEGTALGTYRVCAVFGKTTALAGRYTVLSSSPPGVTISPSTLSTNQPATITASNYFPAGTQVNFLWVTSNNTVVDILNSSFSDVGGVATMNFTTPNNMSIASGSYLIQAYAGSGQPPTLFASTNFTYNIATAQPSPTPDPASSPSATPSPAPTQNATITTTPTTQASATAAAGATPTAGPTQTVGSNQTPTSNGVPSGNNGGSSTGGSTTSSSNTLLLVAGVVGVLALLIAGLVLASILRRRRKATWRQMTGIPPSLPNSAATLPWANPQGVFMNNGNMPSNMSNGAMGNPNAGTYMPYAPYSGPGMAAPQANNMPVMANSPMKSTMPAWLATSPSGRATPGAAGNGTMVAPDDPALDAMRRQAQSGLFVTPRSFKDERSQ